ncbi:putative Non-specific protein-tyrosine kinase [Gigaspora margarita]|uniref:Putative Non-specific protein-tyrosine kinase n=1 Tax=Gigaspora margarita TaxID=4874 RepID=A0A8H3XIH7_GIGMA|nr:putative Non-specific protein-tyrosine kinase [Gigaspora margarita]
MEMELKRMKRKRLNILKNPRKWGMQMECIFVGEYYRQGIIVEKNIDIAFEWYLKSAMTEQYTSRTKQEYFHWVSYNKFENTEEIGKGAFSTVFKTKYLNRYGSHENVAIKIVKGSNKNKEQFLNEVFLKNF